MFRLSGPDHMHLLNSSILNNIYLPTGLHDAALVESEDAVNALVRIPGIRDEACEDGLTGFAIAVGLMNTKLTQSILRSNVEPRDYILFLAKEILDVNPDGDSRIERLQKCIRQHLAFEDNVQEEEERKVRNIICDGCEMYPVVGMLYNCDECEDFDLCEKCKANGLHRHHKMTRIEALPESPQITSDQPSSKKPTLEDQESEEDLLNRAIAMSLEGDAQEEEAIDPSQMTEEEQLEYAMKVSLQ